MASATAVTEAAAPQQLLAPTLAPALLAALGLPALPQGVGSIRVMDSR